MTDFSNKKISESLRTAFNGLKLAAREKSFQLFYLIAAFVLILMFIFKIPDFQKLILILTITIVMSLELINSQVERILNFFYPVPHPEIKTIKNITAGAVLLTCIGALIIGILIFLPYLLKFLLKYF